MEKTYEALLRGDQLEWLNGRPTISAGVRVRVTIADPDVREADEQERGARRAAALQRIADRGGVDYALWEQERRNERPLPGRSE